MKSDSQPTDWHADVQEAINILLSDDRPTHEAVILLRRALGLDVFGLPEKRVTLPSREVGFTLNQKAESITRVPKIDPGPWK